VREPGVEDATRRTRLANERTFLAWWRTGLTALAVGVGIGRVTPELADVEQWPYEVVGAGFVVLAIAFVWIAYLRTRTIERALDRGEFTPLGTALPMVLLVAGLLLGAATFLLIAFAR
jgi:putative membrane protein